MRQPSEIEVVLFDLGGTLIDYPQPSWHVMLGQCAGGVYGFFAKPESERPRRAADVPEPHEAHALRGPSRPGMPWSHRLMLALRRMVRSLSGRTLPRIAEACARPIVAPGHLFEDTLPTLRALKARGYRLGLISNTPWGTPDYLWASQLERFGLDVFFEVRLFSSHIGFRKPDPRIFRLAMDRMSTTPDRTLYVGDTPEADILGARRSNLRSVLIARPGSPRRPPTPAPDVRIAGLDDLLTFLPPRPQRA
jgi:FMN phosphatase YigB (HAD superfamily)